MTHDRELLESFLAEGRDHLAHLTRLLSPALQGKELRDEATTELRAHVHNLKGVSGLMGFSSLHALVAHLLDSLDALGLESGLPPALASAALTTLGRMFDNIETEHSERNADLLLDFEQGTEIFLATLPEDSAAEDADPELAPLLAQEVIERCAHVDACLGERAALQRPADRQRAAVESLSWVEGLAATALVAGRPDVSRLAASLVTLLDALRLGQLPASSAMLKLALEFSSCLPGLAASKTDGDQRSKESPHAAALIEALTKTLRQLRDEPNETAETGDAHLEQGNLGDPATDSPSEPPGAPTPSAASTEEDEELRSLFAQEAGSLLVKARLLLVELGEESCRPTEPAPASPKSPEAPKQVLGAAGRPGKSKNPPGKPGKPPPGPQRKTLSSRQEALAGLFRALHTLKGGAATVAASAMAEQAHALEERLAQARERGTLAAEDPEFLSAGLRGLETELQTLLHPKQHHLGMAQAPTTQLPPAHEMDPPALSEESPQDLRLPLADIESLLERGDQLAGLQAKLHHSLGRFRDHQQQVTRVRQALHAHLDAFRYDRVLTLPRLLQTPPGAGGVAVTEGRRALIRPVDEAESLASTLESLDEALGEAHGTLDSDAKHFEEQLGQLQEQTTRLQTALTRLRFVPLSSLFGSFDAPLQRLAKAEGKQVRLRLEGGATEMDGPLVESLRDALLHLIRNAIAHGIGTPEQRAAAGKDPVGLITLRAVAEGSTVKIEVEDDGRGLDPARLRIAALNSRLLDAEAAQALNDRAALELIFVPGFSTRGNADLLAGRGIGLDAVADRVATLGAVISCSAAAGSGCLFSMRIPVSATILPYLGLRSGAHRLALPLVAVQETLLLDREALASSKSVRWRDRELPIVRLADQLRTPGRPTQSRRAPAVVIGQGESLALLHVDELLSRGEGRMLPLGSLLAQHPLYSCGLRNAEGALRFVLSPRFLLSASLGAHLGQWPPSAGSLSIQADPAPLQILVVDDSPTVRLHLEHLLKSAGYRVRCACDGAEALQVMETDPPALLLTDLEMPVMNGYQLISKLRALHPQLPVLVLSSRTTAEHQDKARSLGAREVLTKPIDAAELRDALAALL